MQKEGDSIHESTQTQELKDKVQNIISKYEERLTSAGVKIVVSKRYFETDVEDRISYSYDAGVQLLKRIDYYFAKKRERKYKHERNKYHCIIISVFPIDKNLVRRECCKDYAFVLRKAERDHIGQKPKRIIYDEDKLLLKIEKRILKIIKNAENCGVQKACKDTFFDVIRYITLSKYEYKSMVLGKERSSWDLIFLLITVMITVAFVLSAWKIGSLF